MKNINVTSGAFQQFSLSLSKLCNHTIIDVRADRNRTGENQNVYIG